MTTNSFGLPVFASPCPDCTAELRVVQLAAGVNSVEIYHDDTCPTLAQIMARTA